MTFRVPTCMWCTTENIFRRLRYTQRYAFHSIALLLFSLGYGLQDRENVVRFPAGAKYFSLLRTSSGTQKARK
jgi:hypothetical protein